MQERERIVIGSLVLLLLLLWLGFLVHRSPRFPGSPWGGALAVSGALLMLGGVAYSLVKRVPSLKAALTRRVPMRTLLAWHVYTGVLGAILALLHTGHKFDNALWILLTATMFAAVLTGYVGRHFMALISRDLREKEAMLAQLQASYRQMAAELAQPPAPIVTGRTSGLFRRFAALFFMLEAPGESEERAPAPRAVGLAESMADLEYSIRSHELLKRAASRWLALHIGASLIFCLLWVKVVSVAA
jgi:uncharacterized membrane protein YsdA (DUF1294 family)